MDWRTVLVHIILHNSKNVLVILSGENSGDILCDLYNEREDYNSDTSIRFQRR